VGVSKGCCFMCSLYMGLQGNVEVRTTTGKIFPWAMPPWERDPAIYQQVWRELKERVWDCLQKMELLTVKGCHSDGQAVALVRSGKLDLSWRNRICGD